MKTLQLRNVFGKPVKVTSGAIKVKGLPDKGEEGVQYYDTLSKEYYSYDNGKWTSITQESTINGDSPKIINMGEYGDYFFLGGGVLFQLFPEIMDEYGFKIGAVLNSVEEPMTALENNDIDSPGSFMHNIKKILKGELTSKILSTVMPNVVAEIGEPGNTPSRQWIDTFKEYVQNANIEKTFTASALELYDVDYLEDEWLKSRKNLVSGIKYDVQVFIRVLGCYPIGTANDGYTLQYFRYVCTITILNREPINDSTIYYFPKHRVNLSFIKHSILSGGRDREPMEVDVYEANVEVINRVRVRINQEVADIIDSDGCGYPQKLGEYLQFETTEVDINSTTLDMVPSGSDVELVGSFVVTSDNYSFSIQGDGEFSVLNPELTVGGLYEYHIHKCSGIVNFVKLTQS